MVQPHLCDSRSETMKRNLKLFPEPIRTRKTLLADVKPQEKGALEENHFLDSVSEHGLKQNSKIEPSSNTSRPHIKAVAANRTPIPNLHQFSNSFSETEDMVWKHILHSSRFISVEYYTCSDEYNFYPNLRPTIIFTNSASRQIAITQRTGAYKGEVSAQFTPEVVTFTEVEGSESLPKDCFAISQEKSHSCHQVSGTQTCAGILEKDTEKLSKKCKTYKTLDQAR